MNRAILRCFIDLFSSDKRAYKLTKIQPLTVKGSQNYSANLINITAAIKNVSDLFNVVNNQKYLELALNGNRTSDDEATMRRIVDDVARNAGYTERGFRGTEAPWHSTFKAEYIFTTDDMYTARTYAGANGTVFDLYINPKNILKVDGDGHPNTHISIPQELNPEGFSWMKYGTTDEICRLAKEQGYDGVDFGKIGDTGTHFDWVVGEDGFNRAVIPEPSRVMAVFNTNKVKSAALITYDANGDVIPLTERFRTDRTGADAWKNNDIRYSTRSQKDAKRIKIETDKPVQSSVCQSKSIQQRTMDAVHALVESKKLAEEEAKKYEIVGITVQKLCMIYCYSLLDPKAKEAYKLQYVAERDGFMQGSP